MIKTFFFTCLYFCALWSSSLCWAEEDFWYLIPREEPVGWFELRSCHEDHKSCQETELSAYLIAEELPTPHLMLTSATLPQSLLLTAVAAVGGKAKLWKSAQASKAILLLGAGALGLGWLHKKTSPNSFAIELQPHQSAHSQPFFLNSSEDSEPLKAEGSAGEPLFLVPLDSEEHKHLHNVSAEPLPTRTFTHDFPSLTRYLNFLAYSLDHMGVQLAYAEDIFHEPYEPNSSRREQIASLYHHWLSGVLASDVLKRRTYISLEHYHHSFTSEEIAEVLMRLSARSKKVRHVMHKMKLPELEERLAELSKELSQLGEELLIAKDRIHGELADLQDPHIRSILSRVAEEIFIPITTQLSSQHHHSSPLDLVAFAGGLTQWSTHLSSLAHSVQKLEERFGAVAFPKHQAIPPSYE